MTAKNITRVSLGDLRSRKGRTYNDAPDGPSLGDDFWRNAQVVEPRPKTSVHLRVDADVLDFFKAQGKGHLTRMNAVLKAYADAHRKP
jgi:hypothetical protein